MDNKEIDEILESIKNRTKSINDIINELPDEETIAPPKPAAARRENAADLKSDGDILPPAEKNNQQVTVEQKSSSTPLPPPVAARSKKEKQAEKPKEKKPKRQRPKIEKKPIKHEQKKKNNSKKRQKPSLKPFVQKLKEKGKKGAKKQAEKIAIAIVALIVAAAAITGAVSYSRTAYLRPYEKKYGIEYPKGIIEEMCSAYGKNQNTVAKLYSPDADVAQYVASKAQNGFALAENSTNFSVEQQFGAIYAGSQFSALEEKYCTAEGYLDSTQSLELTTLYEKKQYRIINTFYVNTDPADDEDYVFFCNFSGDLTQESFARYRQAVRARSLYLTDDTLSYKQKYLAVAIDSRIYDGYRFVMLCRENTDGSAKYTSAKTNINPHYPQSYYDDTEETNPYRFAAKWYPTVYTDEEHTKTKTITNQK